MAEETSGERHAVPSACGAPAARHGGALPHAERPSGGHHGHGNPGGHHGSGGHGHAHGAGGDRGRLAVALAITVGVVVAEVVGGLLAGSVALLADAGHLLTDAAGLVIALIAAQLARRPPTDARTWGFQRAEVLAASAQAAVLLAVGVAVVVEGVRRLVHPEPVTASLMVVFGVVGLVGSAASLVVLAGGSRGLSTRAALLEAASDAGASAAVVVAALVVAATGATRADAVVSLLVGVLILPRTVALLRETTDVLLEATPRGLDLADVRAHLVELDHVHAVHDLHASAISSGLPVLTAHVVVDASCFRDGHAPAILDALQACVAEHFPLAVEHSTFQLEPVGHSEHESAGHH